MSILQVGMEVVLMFSTNDTVWQIDEIKKDDTVILRSNYKLRVMTDLDSIRELNSFEKKYYTRLVRMKPLNFIPERFREELKWVE